jgi:Tfp pilus assembly protein PilF
MVTLIDKGSLFRLWKHGYGLYGNYFCATHRSRATQSWNYKKCCCRLQQTDANQPLMKTQVSEDIIKAQFADDGSFVNEMLEDADYVATSLWLQLRLWTFLGYMAEDNERFVLLAVLFLCDTQYGRRLDPGQPRIKKEVSPGADTV